MRRLILGIAAAMLLVACGSDGDKKAITPAESMLLGCDAYASALTTLAPMRADGKLNQGTVDIVEHVRTTLNPLCEGPAPDVNATVKDVAVDAGVRTLQSIIAQVL